MPVNLTNRDILFRTFQIMKFNKKNLVPAVTMTINVNASQILKLKDHLNNENNNTPHITLTHVIVKAIADTLMKYPILYSFFDGKKIVENDELIFSIPVDVESHVEYIVIRNPELKSIEEISEEFHKELNSIHSGNGAFMRFLLYFDKMPAFRKLLDYRGMDGKIRFLKEHYGIFSISNFGSFHINGGTLPVVQPVIAALCIGSIVTGKDCPYLPLTLTFDHRPIDGAYAGKFLYDVKTILEQPDLITSDRR